jgi:hypothetical protein
MATELLPVASGAANSADFTLAAGETATIALKDAASPEIESGPVVAVQLKDDAAAYWDIYLMTRENNSVVISAAGTYRVRRVANGVSVGAFRG